MIIQFLGNCSIKIKTGNTVIYIDPFGKEEYYEEKADIILISEKHYGHFKEELVKKVRVHDHTRLFVHERIAYELDGDAIKEYETKNAFGISVMGVHSYNTRKTHPKHAEKGEQIGFLLKIEKKFVYFAGDSDLIKEMEDLRCDIAFLHVGGTFGMNARQAFEAVKRIKPRMVIPIGWGKITAYIEDAEYFKEKSEFGTETQVKVLKEGEEIEI